MTFQLAVVKSPLFGYFPKETKMLDHSKATILKQNEHLQTPKPNQKRKEKVISVQSLAQYQNLAKYISENVCK